MINSILISNDLDSLNALKENLTRFCQELSIAGVAKSIEQARSLIFEKYPKLVFMDTHIHNQNSFEFLKSLPSLPFEIIFISDNKELAAEAFRIHASGFLTKPLIAKALIEAVQFAKQLIDLKRENEVNRKLLSSLTNDQKTINKIIIPTMDGLEFISIQKIIRCEGLQRCTKVFIQNEKQLVSSNNIGMIANTLLSHDFYISNRSHLININYVKRYDREGNIVMMDGSNVPLSRRKKQGFLERVTE